MAHYDNEDIDDVLSSIMQGQKPLPVEPEKFSLKPKPQSQNQPPVVAHKGQSDFVGKKKPSILEDLSYAPTAPQKPLERRFGSFTAKAQANKTKATSKPTQPKNKQRRTTLTIRRVVLAFSLILVVGVVASGIIYRKALVAYLLPQSPFSQELDNAIQYPLLYPTKLPLGFSIDASSVSKGSNGVIVYNLKNPNGNLIGISLQPEPLGLNRDALLKTLIDPRTINLPAGTTIIGTSEDGVTTSHTLTGTVWVIVRSAKSAVSEQAIEAMLSSLKEG